MIKVVDKKRIQVVAKGGGNPFQKLVDLFKPKIASPIAGVQPEFKEDLSTPTKKAEAAGILSPTTDASVSAINKLRASPAPIVQPETYEPIDLSVYDSLVSDDFKGKIVSPPEEFGKMIQDVFEDKANVAALVGWSENGKWNPQAINKNDNGSLDLGLFQINENTFNDFMKRKGSQLQDLGINNYVDMNDPLKNIQMAKVIYDEQGWGAWYGPKSKGIDMDSL